MEIEDGPEDDGPVYPWLPPEDRLWRHPSEMANGDSTAEVEADGGRGGARVWTVAMAAGLIGALVASGMFVAAGHLEHRTTVIEQVATPRPVLVGSNLSQRTTPGWPAVADSLAPSMAEVTVSGAAGTQQGSGILYAVDRDTTYLLSASDLLTGGGTVTATFDASKPVPAKVVGTDGATGIALLAVPGARRRIPTFGSVSGVAVAEAILAIGSRTTSGVSVAPGSVSGLDQPVDAGGTSLYGMLAVSGLSVGSSSDGGAIVDQYGQVIGVETDTTTLSNQDGLAYAVPVDVAEHVASQLLAGKPPTHPWLGVENTTDLSSAAATALGVVGGAQVGDVVGDSPAAAAGIDANDVITELDGHRVTSAGQLTTLLTLAEPGRTARLTYLDDGRRRSAAVTVGSQPAATGP